MKCSVDLGENMQTANINSLDIANSTKKHSMKIEFGTLLILLICPRHSLCLYDRGRERERVCVCILYNVLVHYIADIYISYLGCWFFFCYFVRYVPFLFCFIWFEITHKRTHICCTSFEKFFTSIQFNWISIRIEQRKHRG